MKTWPTWSFKLGNFLEGLATGIKAALEKVQDAEDPLTEDDREDLKGPLGEQDVNEVSRQLYAVLAQLCEGEALDLVAALPAGLVLALALPGGMGRAISKVAAEALSRAGPAAAR